MYLNKICIFILYIYVYTYNLCTWIAVKSFGIFIDIVEKYFKYLCT